MNDQATGHSVLLTIKNLLTGEYSGHLHHCHRATYDSALVEAMGRWASTADDTMQIVSAELTSGTHLGDRAWDLGIRLHHLKS